MANPYRGDVAAEIGGRRRTLRLTLGALAELEAAFGADDLGDLARVFAAGKLRARDAVRVIAAGLRGAGEPVTDEEVAAMAIDGGAAGYAALVVALVAATFAPGGASPTTEGGGADGAPFADPPRSPGTPRSDSASACSASPPTPSGR
ncbi:gene transfer agent family protein [Oharaeibacter diazotrophicus]|uniref:Tail tube GTA-gp10-like protein n=2 Tax=Oharaeibacter diazotrophicus TaxID=1920512 RepID=A0A4V3CVP4_9HYPH|nr:tail tube GTA-gp10-like protein [Oharaeibacter diazotrophicus]BBE72050.1 hypothetical protein OHA_1_01637 [Pleomorphomonas sp. SM30]GLS78815.1 hypothetical protein GCM10007904_41520 [Oharaeibacter diazotrophicus]